MQILRSTSPRNTRSGQAIVFVTLSLFFLFSVMGLAVDMGFGYMKRLQLQTAADAAAMGAAMYASTAGGTCTTAVPCGSYFCANPNVSPATTALQAGCIYAGVNGFINGGNGGKQTVSMQGNTTTPATAPGVTTATYWVKATVTEKLPGLFLFWNGFRTENVTAEATAAIGTNASSAANCIYVLNSTASQALLINGSEVISGDCGIFVNSNSSTAAVINGSNIINVSLFKIVGNYTNNGSNSITPTPTISATATADPLANLPAPSNANGSCDQTNYSLNSSGTATLNPGVYCGGITINGSYTVTFNPGVYILQGGGFNHNGSSVLNGSGVMFYNTGTSSTVKPILFNGSATINLTAPTTGTYKGILFYQDRTLTYGQANAFNGSSDGTTGTMYFPTTNMIYNGSQNAVFQALICDTLTFNGSTTLKKDLTGTYTGLAKTTVGMIE